jgi:hypothetical protein
MKLLATTFPLAILVQLVRIAGMSRIAGIILIIYGAWTAYVGFKEVSHPAELTRFAAFATTALGAFLLLVGLGHFKAPHKAFLTSIPLLIAFHIQMYFNKLIYFDDPKWSYQVTLLAISIIALTLSYFGYKKQVE